MKETFASVTGYLGKCKGEKPDVYAMAALVNFHDPAIRELRTEEVPRQTMQKYRTEGHAFLLVLPGLHALRESRPGVASLIEHSGQFRLLARHYGIEFANRSYDLWIFSE